MVLTPLRVALAAAFAFAEGLLGLPPVDVSRCLELGHCDLESPVISCASVGKKDGCWGRYKSRMRCDLLFLLSFGAIADVGVVGRWSSCQKSRDFDVWEKSASTSVFRLAP